MLNRNNAHFEELRRIGDEYEERRRAHEEKKQQIWTIVKQIDTKMRKIS